MPIACPAADSSPGCSSLMEGRPFTASKLAAYLDTPRTSVLRKLAQLKREGFVEQRGHTYVLHDHLLNSVGIEDTRAAIRMIRSLAEQLIQFDNEGVQNGHENRPQNHQPAYQSCLRDAAAIGSPRWDDGTVHGPS